MIQLIALNGKMASGKTTIAKALSSDLGFRVLSIGTTIKKTCTYVIEDLTKLYGYLRDMVDDPVMLESIYDEIISTFRDSFGDAVWEKDEHGFYHKTQPYRDLTQMVASMVRKKLGDEVWVQFCIKEAKEKANKGEYIVIDDLRLPAEKELFEQNGYCMIRVDVTKEVQNKRLLEKYGEINEEQRNHITETALDTASFDLRVDNSEGDPDIAIQKIIHFIKAEGLVTLEEMNLENIGDKP